MSDWKPAEQPVVGNCWYCGAGLTAAEYGRQETCQKCRRDTKVCKNCEFYDLKSNNQCHEPQADRQVEKERSNFCDYFKPRLGSKGVGGPTVDAAKAAAEALFKQK